VLFSLVILASITVGRMGFGIELALHSTYTCFSIPAVVGVYAMLVKLVSDGTSRLASVSVGVLSVLMLLSIPASYADAAKEGRGTGARDYASSREYRERAAFLIYTYESQPDDLLDGLYPGTSGLIREHARTLERLGYNVFSGAGPRVLPPPLAALSPVPSATSFSIDSVADAGVAARQPIIVPKGERFITVKGWAVDAKAKDAAGGIYIDIDGELFPAFYGLDRQDVADSQKNPSYKDSGFERAIPVREIGAGSHELSIVVLTNDKQGYYRPGQKVTLEIG
jgi:hypothetical protein